MGLHLFASFHISCRVFGRYMMSNQIVTYGPDAVEDKKFKTTLLRLMIGGINGVRFEEPFQKEIERPTRRVCEIYVTALLREYAVELVREQKITIPLDDIETLDFVSCKEI
jgi:hypothetical protein